MARIDDVNALLAAMNTATNAIAAKIADLIAQIQAGGLTDAEEQQVIASLQEQVARLEALAANPNDPIPNP